MRENKYDNLNLNQSNIEISEISEISDSPLYIKIFVAFSAWLAAIFLGAFFAIAFSPYKWPESFLAAFGGILIIVAIKILLGSQKNIFLENLGLATSMAGQFLIAFFLLDHLSWGLALIAFSCLHITLFLITPNFTGRLISATAAGIALAWGMDDLFLGSLAIIVPLLSVALVFCWLTLLNNRLFKGGFLSKWLQRLYNPAEMLTTLGYGLALSVASGKAYSLISGRHNNHEFMGFWHQPWLAELLSGAVLLYLAWHILKGYSQTIVGRSARFVLTLALLLCFASLKIYGLSTAAIMIFLAAFVSNRALLAIGIGTGLLLIGRYYYTLNLTLLDKSISLFVFGSALLLARVVMLKYWGSKTVVNSTD